ncbi:MAG TPA: AraC family transcriptional regulator [Vicinamibacterales bacterium]|jgi:AraC-like DNA-binding protein
MQLELVGDALSEILIGDRLPDTLDTRRRWPSWAGEGTLEWLEIQPGVLLWISDLMPAAALRVSGSRDDGYASYSYYVRGGFRLTSVRWSKAFDIDEGHQQIRVSAPSDGGVGLLEAHRRSAIVSFSLSRRAAVRLLGTLSSTQTDSCLNALESERSCAWAPREMTRAERALALQIATCPFAGRARALFLESKVLELLAHDLARSSPRSSTRRLSADDEGRIRAAAQLLVDRCDAPPSIRELARAVGVNDLKLKRSFPQLFGTTVFGYLRQHRMNQAYELLERGEATVGEAASRVGYTCPSRFTVAFRRHFGVIPSSVRATRRIIAAKQ